MTKWIPMWCLVGGAALSLAFSEPQPKVEPPVPTCDPPAYKFCTPNPNWERVPNDPPTYCWPPNMNTNGPCKDDDYWCFCR